MSFGGYFGHILSLETIKSTYLLYNLVGIIYASWVYTERRQSAWAYKNKAELANQVSNMCGIKNGVNKLRGEFIDSSIGERMT